MMYDPPHPGEIIREDCIAASGLSITEAARNLGVSRQSLSELLNGRANVSVEMALRLERMEWSSAETWLGVQQAYDLWQARHRHA
jgi:antitoxin HigA-1